MSQDSGDIAPDQDPDVGRGKKARVCPDCGSVETRLSKQGGILVALFGLLNMSKYKCKGCGRRFFAGN